MTSPSAGRPLPLPEKIKSFTEEDVMLVAKAIGADYWIPSDRSAAARDILAALAAAGRLLPPDAEHREEWNVRLPKPGGYSIVDDSMTKRWPPDPGEIREDVTWWKDHAGVDVIPVKRIVSEFADGSWFMGPWVEVDRSTDGV